MFSKSKLILSAFALAGSIQTANALPGEAAHLATCPSPQTVLADKSGKTLEKARTQGCGFFYQFLSDKDSKQVQEQSKQKPKRAPAP